MSSVPDFSHISYFRVYHPAKNTIYPVVKLVDFGNRFVVVENENPDLSPHTFYFDEVVMDEFVSHLDIKKKPLYQNDVVAYFYIAKFEGSIEQAIQNIEGVDPLDHPYRSYDYWISQLHYINGCYMLKSPDSEYIPLYLLDVNRIEILGTAHKDSYLLETVNHKS